jgi:hypothetical protein
MPNLSAKDKMRLNVILHELLVYFSIHLTEERKVAEQVANAIYDPALSNRARGYLQTNETSFRRLLSRVLMDEATALDPEGHNFVENIETNT